MCDRQIMRSSPPDILRVSSICLVLYLGRSSLIGINGLERSKTQEQHEDKEKPGLWLTARCALRRGFTTLAEPVVAPSEF